MTRFYLSNVASPYDPPLATVADADGDWDRFSTSTSKLSRVKEGAAASAGLSVGSTDATYDVLNRRFISDALTVGGTIQGSAEWVLKAREDSDDLNAYSHVHLWVTQGDSNTPRGTLVADRVGAVELSSSTTYTAYSDGVIVVNPVAAHVGDRIVAEIGYRASSTATTFVSFLRRGGAGGDATVGDTDNANPTWVELSGLSGLAVTSASGPIYQTSQHNSFH